MANLYGTPATCSSSSSPADTSDDISLFLRQILLKSASSTPYSSPCISNKQMQCEIQPIQPVYPSGLSIPEGIPIFSAPNGAYTPANAVTCVASSSVGTVDNDIDEHDCESEDGFENLMDEMAAKSNAPRNPSKRTRPPEVHNLSEKRRRSRINEKMKALQKLIPNSNKTDKASMLDEAIEYLKQLQLRVQMLTMRNGMNLYSMSAPPGALHIPHSRISLTETENMTSLNQETGVNQNPMLSLPIQRSSQNPQSIHGFSHIINPGSSSSFRERLLSSTGSERVHLVNSQHKLALPANLDQELQHK